MSAVVFLLLADILRRQRNKHASGHGCCHEARRQITEVDLDVLEHVLRVLLDGDCVLVLVSGQHGEGLLLLCAPRNAAQHVVDDVARDVGHAGAPRRGGAGAIFF